MSDPTPSVGRPAMTFGASVRTALSKYAQFDGRAGVSEFWWFALFLGLVGAALVTIGELFPNADRVSAGLAQLWTIVTLLPLLAAAVRRLRDGGNAWTQVLWILIPIAGLIVVIIRLCDPSLPPPGDSSEATADGAGGGPIPGNPDSNL
jgi:uncharacterized membrane protein YhaH (DUF805 family)